MEDPVQPLITMRATPETGYPQQSSHKTAIQRRLMPPRALDPGSREEGHCVPCCRSSTLTSYQPTPVTELPTRQNPEPSSHGERREQVPATQAGSQTSRQMVSALGLEEEDKLPVETWWSWGRPFRKASRREGPGMGLGAQQGRPMRRLEEALNGSFLTRVHHLAS